MPKSKRATASSSGATGINLDKDDAAFALRRANLPSRVAKLTSNDFKTKGASLLAYIKSPAYADDFANGKGFCLYGNPAVRSDLFALVAKGLALQDRGVWFCSVHYLVNSLDHAGDDERQRLTRYPNLFIDWFEKDFGSEQSPYSLSQRAEVEEFLATRLRAGSITNFSAFDRWDKLRWWSRDFLALFSPNVVNISI